MRKTFWLAASLGAWLHVGLVSSSYAVDGVNSVEQLLSRLSHTLQEKNYRGLFTYEYGGSLDTLEIVHVVQEGKEYEHLQHLSGPSREVFRRGREVNCVSTGAQLLRGGLFSPQANGAQLHQYYNLSVAGDERVANRRATVVRLVPKDHYRYGLTLSVDRASGFPVKTLVVGDNQQVIERIQFLELDFGVAADILASSEADVYQVAAANSDSCHKRGEGQNPVQTPTPNEPPLWQAHWLPRGFVLADQSYSESDGHHLTYTDGLSSFSVFITAADARHPVQPGVAQRGATVALITPLPLGNQVAANVAVVGEIPPVTAEQVALNMRPRGQGK